jgi:hypothetical protein
MKRSILLLCVTLFIAAASGPSSAHNLLFAPTQTELSRNPFYFLIEVQSAFDEYKREKNRYPSSWNEVWPCLSKKASGSRLLSDSFNQRDGKILRVKDKELKPLCIYVIDDASAQTYSVHSEGAGTEYRIVQDCQDILWYFRSVKDELAKLEQAEKDYSKTTILRKYIGQGDPKYIGDWRFDHPAAVDLLIRFLREDKLLFYTKHGVVSALKKTAHLSRYRGKAGELKAIFEKEKGKPFAAEDAANRTLYLDALADLIRTLQ